MHVFLYDDVALPPYNQDEFPVCFLSLSLSLYKNLLFSIKVITYTLQ